MAVGEDGSLWRVGFFAAAFVQLTNSHCSIKLTNKAYIVVRRLYWLYLKKYVVRCLQLHARYYLVYICASEDNHCNTIDTE